MDDEIQRLREALENCKSLLDHIHEFGTVIEPELIDIADDSVEAALAPASSGKGEG